MDIRKMWEALAELDPEFNWPKVGRMLTALVDQLEWADQEINAARVRHPGRSRLNGEELTELLHPTAELMQQEPTYRAHCRELLDRVAAGEDTQPGTDAELCCMFGEFSPFNLMTHAANLVYLRAFERLHPGRLGNEEMIRSLEYSDSYEANRVEKTLRRKLGVKGRALPFRSEKWKEPDRAHLLEDIREDVEGAA